MTPTQHCVVGFNDPYHDSSFCLYGQESLIHVEMERFSRRKYESENPILGFCDLYPDYIESLSCLAIEEGDFLAPLVRRCVDSGSFPGHDSRALSDLVHSASAPLLTPSTAGRTRRTTDPNVLQRLFHRIAVDRVPVYFVGHHEAHAANAFFSSGLDSALTVTLDAGGYDYPFEGAGPDERVEVHGSVYRCSGTKLERLASLQEYSFGLAWTRTTELLGLQWGEEGTAMAMAAFGDPARFAPSFREPFFWLPHAPYLTTGSLAALNQFLDSTRRAVSTDQDRFDVAAALQAETERRVEEYLRRFITDGVQNLCVGGGLFLNCQMLGKIARWFPQLQTTFIPPAPYDGGISIGAAQFVLHHKLGVAVSAQTPAPAPFSSGPTYSEREVLASCANHGLVVHRAGDEEVVELIVAGSLCGVFAGAAESGRRALGHRSIVADPRTAEIRDRINAVIKHRQWFRPLAPMVLSEYAHAWFDCEEGFASPYMSHAVQVRPAMKRRVPAIVHADGTARVQTVHRGLSPVLHSFLSTWLARTGVPLLVNTSFNDREPIVQTPDDALATFKRVPLDALYFMDVGILVRKEPSDRQ